MTGSRPSEFELIAKYFAPMAGHGALGLLDDAACIVPPPGQDLVITKDMLVAGRHFFENDPPEMIAAKALRVNLSDLAAKGARPLGFVLGLALPEGWQAAWLERFAQGLAKDAKALDCPMLGGDTVKASGSLTLSITAFGAVPSGRMVERLTAQPGDWLYVTGTIGDAALGLKLRQGKDVAALSKLSDIHRETLLYRYLCPQPRNAMADSILSCATASMDVSDGLVGDLRKMLARGLSVEISAANIPVSQAAREALALDPALMETILTGGDDYELLATVRPQNAARFERETANLGIGVTRLGEMRRASVPALTVLNENGKPMRFITGSYIHF